MGPLKDRGVLVTGGGGLLGAAFCRALAAAGARVAVNDVASERAQAVVRSIRETGGHAEAIPGSVGSWTGAGEVVDQSIERLGGLDCLVNAAHTTRAVALRDLDEAALRETLDIHVIGHFACTHHATRQMIRQGRGGSVVNLISRATQGLRDYSAYAAAKGAILSATFTWALELAREGIRVNALSPAARDHEPGAPVNLRMPWKREAGQTAEQMRKMTPPPESVAPLVVYLASEISHWVSGQAFFLAGDSLALIRHPMETQIARRPEGWDVDSIDRELQERLTSAFEQPGMQKRKYAWSAGVTAKPFGSDA